MFKRNPLEMMVKELKVAGIALAAVPIIAIAVWRGGGALIDAHYPSIAIIMGGAGVLLIAFLVFFGIPECLREAWELWKEIEWKKGEPARERRRQELADVERRRAEAGE